jgi:predicted nucleotidyltransferase
MLGGEKQGMKGSVMNPLDKAILDRFKALVSTRFQLHKVVLFGSRARGHADPDSDLDVVVVLEDAADGGAEDYVSHCAWEAGFEHGVVVVPVVFTRHEWEYGPERQSLFVQAVETEGVPV